MKKLTMALLAFIMLWSNLSAGTVRIEDNATSSNGLCSYDGALKSYSGASNGYAINLSNATAKGITWMVEGSAAGTFTLTWRYVNGSSSAATTAKLIINGTTVTSSLSFPKTADKSTFTTTSTSATLVKGVNQIRIETTSGSEFADIDYIEITGNIIGAANCSAAIGSGGGSSTVAVTGVSVSPTSSTLTSAGATVQLTATVSPSTATNKTVSWSSSNTAVATISSSGLVTAVANGSATITVTTADGAKTATSSITVSIASSTVSVTGVSVSPTSATITTSGGTTQLTATVSPSNATNKTVTWSSSNTSVATVSSAGLVTAVANGSATITVKTSDGAKTATSAITVNISSGTSSGSTDMVGYATVNGEGYSTTTGGSGGSSITITTFAQLESWVASRENNTTPEIVYINGKITNSTSTVLTIKHGANISIYGVGTSGELQNVGLNIRDYQNVIVRNLKIHEVFYPNDALTIDACLHVWVDHNELYSQIGAGITVDTYDGLLDIKNGSRYVTVSWNYLHHHMKCMLYGHTDNTNNQATDQQMRITLHHNWISYTDGRNPSLRYGVLHMYNNYLEEISDYGIAARDGAHAKLENNHLNNVLLSMSTDKFPVSGLPNGYICASGNSLTGNTGAAVISQSGCDFWTSSILPYSYSLDAVGNVAATVKANAGIGKVTNLKSAPAGSVLAQTQNWNTKPFIAYNENGTGNEARIKFNIEQAEHVKISVFDASGRIISIISNKNYPAGTSDELLPVSQLHSGVYFILFESTTATHKLKLLTK